MKSRQCSMSLKSKCDGLTFSNYSIELSPPYLFMYAFESNYFHCVIQIFCSQLLRCTDVHVF